MATLKITKIAFILLLYCVKTVFSCQPAAQEEQKKMTLEPEYLFDFTTKFVDKWYEVSDTVRDVGKSKATMVLQKTQIFQRAILFALLNPQSNGAAFAGMYFDGPYDFKSFSGFEIKLKLQSLNIKQWKVILKQLKSDDRFETYEHKFEPKQETNHDFEIVTMKFSDFHQHINGTINPNEPALDLAKIATFGFQTFGGVYDDFKQSGPGSLELDYVKLI
jgi:NADH dehydrogenase [ubiquinone] 1 alpha subcomplex assembly factor 1